MTQSTETKKKIRIAFNAPVVLTFSLICLISLILGSITNNWTTVHFFSIYQSSLADPLTYVRFIGHIFGHADINHFMGNITLLLVVGPILEEKYGSGNLVVVILATAIITGLVHFLFFPHIRLLGASGVVFSFILLASFVSFKDGTIPMTFILVALIYIGGQIYEGIFVVNNISNLTHIVGGGVGSFLGYYMSKNKLYNEKREG